MEAGPPLDQSRPQPSVNERDLALDQATHKDFVAVADGSRHAKIRDLSDATTSYPELALRR